MNKKNLSLKPNKHVVCPSWPHIWAHPLVDRYGRSSLASSMINASMSALKAMDFATPYSGAFPIKSTIKPVLAQVLIYSSSIYSCFIIVRYINRSEKLANFYLSIVFLKAWFGKSVIQLYNWLLMHIMTKFNQFL